MSANAATEGRLCPAMCCLPIVGSFFAHVLVTDVELVRKVLNIILMLPAFVHMWGKQETLPLVTH